MQTYRITNSKSGMDLGTFQAEDEQGALEAFAREAGYASYAEACEEHPVAEGEMVVEEVEVSWQVGDRVEGGDVWPDYDTGVVLAVGDKARGIADFYKTKHDMIDSPVWVAWDNGTAGLADAAELRPEGERPIVAEEEVSA